MAQFKKIIESATGKAHYRLTMGPKEAASLVALLDDAGFTGHYLDRVSVAVNESESSFDLHTATVTEPIYGVVDAGEINIE